MSASAVYQRRAAASKEITHSLSVFTLEYGLPRNSYEKKTRSILRQIEMSSPPENTGHFAQEFTIRFAQHASHIHRFLSGSGFDKAHAKEHVGKSGCNIRGVI